MCVKQANYYSENPSMTEDAPFVQTAHPVRHPLQTQPNGTYKQPHSPTFEGRALNYENDHGYLAPTRVNNIQRKGSNISGNGSDPDSLLEYYNGHPDHKNGVQGPLNNKKLDRKMGPQTNMQPENGDDESKWIHRDKLAQIESKELEAAGFRVGRTSRSNSRSTSANRLPRNRKNSEAGHQHADAHRITSPVPIEDDERHHEAEGWDLRTPEEIAADNHASRPHTIRPSTSRIPLAPGGTSRIPVAKTSPVPVPHTFVERDAPLPRSRKGSTGWNGDAIAVNGARVRSGSASSHVLLDDVLGGGERTPPNREPSSPTSPKNMSPKNPSPPKGKTPSKTTPASGNRKASTQRNVSQAKPRNTSAQPPVKRPGTSGGLASRPTTSHRPEGEAPWIASMYKPDPRLPPEQQIIPTHAKRMQQEQWENEGKVGSVYDTEFRLLNTEEFRRKQEEEAAAAAAQVEEERKKEEEKDEQWPLPSPTKPSPLAPINTSIKSPTSEQGGYKLTPTVPLSPRIPSRASIRPITEVTSVTRIPEPPAEAKEKKSCGCIVM